VVAQTRTATEPQSARACGKASIVISIIGIVVGIIVIVAFVVFRMIESVGILVPIVRHGDGSVAEWLACWTQAQKGPGSNRSRDAVG